MEMLDIKYKEFKGKTVNDYTVVDAVDNRDSYVIVLGKGEDYKIFVIRKVVIPAKALKRESDTYELWYKNYEHSKLLSLEEMQDINIVLTNIKELIDKYSKYDK